MTGGANLRHESGDRRRIRAFALVAAIALVGSTAMRVAVPPPLAPRVHVRWADGTSDVRRIELERRFALAEGQRRDDATWAYDLGEPSPAAVLALVSEPAVADTHYVDRRTGQVAADAPRGTTRLGERAAAGWIHSALFDLFIVFWLSALVVSGVWLASAANAPRR